MCLFDANIHFPIIFCYENKLPVTADLLRKVAFGDSNQVSQNAHTKLFYALSAFCSYF